MGAEGKKHKNKIKNRIPNAFSVSKWEDGKDYLESLRPMVFIWLGICGITGWLGDLFDLTFSRPAVILASLLLCLALEFLTRNRDRVTTISWFMILAIIPPLLGMIPLVKKGYDGLFHDAYLNLRSYGIAVFYRGSQVESNIAKTLAVVIFACWIYLFLRMGMKYQKILFIIFPLILLAVQVRFGNEESPIWCLLLLVWILMILVTSMRAYLFMAAPLLALLIILGFFFGFGIEGNHGWKAAWDSYRYGGKQEELPDGNLRQTADLQRSDEEKIHLTGYSTGYYYLKGFVGTIYEDSSWKCRDDILDDFEGGIIPGESDFLTWLHEKGGSGWNELATKLPSREENVIYVQNVGANRRYLYVPYELKTTVETLEEENMAISGSGESLYALGLFGKKEYALAMIPSLAGSQISTGGLSSYDIEKRDHYASYEEYVRLSCLSLSKEKKEVIAREVDENAGNGYVDTMATVAKVRKWLKENITYNENPGQIPENTDFVNWFFKDNRQGYDIHYASAAVMLFRYYGIPARYVEGYLVENNSRLTGQSAHAWPEIFLSGKGWVPVEVMDQYQERMPSYLPEDGEKIVTDNNVTDNNKETEEKESEASTTEEVQEEQTEETTETTEETTESGGGAEENTQATGQEEGQNGFDKTFAIPTKILILAGLVLLIILIIFAIRFHEMRFFSWAVKSISPERTVSMWYQYCIWLIYLLEKDGVQKEAMTVDNRMESWKRWWKKNHKGVGEDALHQALAMRQKSIYRKRGVEWKEAEPVAAFYEKEFHYFYEKLPLSDRLRVKFGLRPAFLKEKFHR